jgi:hypothetical protein
VSREFGVLDQLGGGDLPVSVLRGLFSDDGKFHRAILAMVESGDVEVFEPSTGTVPLWRLQELSREQSSWWNDQTLRARITAAGTRRL